ncbi:MAG: dihydrolipoyl dehydrogenase [Chitinophagales bacterium]|nr:MAG: dihydrolipoyl dehydrogenase [Chitinophagales bacterium]
MPNYDVTIIGSGPGGYIAAIRCAQLGFRTAIIERYPTLGGTCLNVGCIPSKALLDSTEHLHAAKEKFKTHGIELTGVKVNIRQMMQRKTEVVQQTTAGVAYLMKKNKIDVYHGHGSFISKNKITIKGERETSEIDAGKVIIATGSKPATLPGVALDKQRIITSTEALSLTEVPESMVVIGGGIIGVELGSVYARLGTKVQIIEYTDTLIGTMDRELGKELLRVLKKLGIEIYLSHKVTGATVKRKKVVVTADDSGGAKKEFTGDYCLVCVGRKPYTENLGLEHIGLTPDDKGRIPVNDRLETAVDGVYAIGDVIRGPMLAHKAEEEGIFVAEVIAGQKPHINYRLIPSVAYTWPEVAGVGFTEEELKESNMPYKKGTFPFKASGRARASMDTEGFIKVLAHAETDEILGVQMIGPRAADLIAEAAVAMEFRASAEDIGMICHPHPTYSEAFKEACLAACANRALNV